MFHLTFVRPFFFFILFVCASIFTIFLACKNKNDAPTQKSENQSLTSIKPVFEDGYPTLVSDVMLDSLYDFYFWLHHRDVTDRAIARFTKQISNTQNDKLALLKAHRRLAVAYMMAYDEPQCTKSLNNMLKTVAQIPDISAEERAKNLAVQAYHAFWFDLTQADGLSNISQADSLMRQAVGNPDLKAVQMVILKSTYLSELGSQDMAVAILDSAMAALEQLPIAYPSVLAWSQLLRTFAINSSIGFKASRARVYFDNKKWENHPVMGKVYDEASIYFNFGTGISDGVFADKNFQKTLHKGHSFIWKNYKTIIESCHQKGNTQKGLEYVALLLNVPKANKAIAYSLAAMIHAQLNHVSIVDDCAEKAMSYANKTKMLPQYQGHMYFYLTNAYKLLKNADKTIFYGEKALPLYEKSLGFHSTDYNTVAYNLAYQYAYFKNDFGKGLEYANKAIASIAYDETDVDLDRVSDEMILNFDYLTLCTVLALKFRHDRDTATYSKVENTLALQYQIFESFNLATQGRAFKSTLFNTNQLSDWAISRNLWIQKKEKAFYHAEHYKLMRMRGAMGFKPATYNIPTQYFERETKLRTEVANLRKQMSEKGENEDSQNQIFTKTKELNNLVIKLETDYPKYYKLKYNSEPAPLADIQKEVVDDTSALISYFVGDTSIYIFTVLKDNLQAQEIKKPKDFLQKIDTFKQILSDANSQIADFSKHSIAIYNLLLKEVLEKMPTHVSKLIIVPDDVLSYIPFEILTPSVSGANYRQSNFLLKRYNISYAYSAHLLLEQQRIKNKKTTHIFAGFAPKYENRDTLFAMTNIAMRTALTRDGTYELPEAKEEVQKISEFMGGTTFMNEAATEQAFKREANQYRILHFAMHSLTDDNNPSFSKLLFTVTPKDTTQDSDLTAGEIYAMSLNADLAVLSACNTGYGKISHGEGVMSLARAFTYAGVPATVTSLWKVPDIMTREIMVNFYKNLKAGMPKDEALRQAKLTYLDRVKFDEKAAPTYWAAFVLSGNTDAVDFDTPLSIWVYWGMGCILLSGLLLFLKYKIKRA